MTDKSCGLGNPCTTQEAPGFEEIGLRVKRSLFIQALGVFKRPDISEAIEL